MNALASGASARQEFEEALGFELDPFQATALDSLDAGKSVLIAAPTGSGKTVVAEYAVERAIAAGRRAFYTTPIKALSNQKFRDLRAAHGSDRVGLLTGDNSINGSAPVVVMTTEVLRNMIYERSDDLTRLGVVVLDEVHYLQDPYRGAVWEEVIIHLDPSVSLVCLSATVSNAEDFGAWLRSVRGGTDVVIEERRPVEIEHRYAVAFRDSEDLLVMPTFTSDHGRVVPNRRGAEFDPVGPSRAARRGRRRSGPRPVPPRRADVVAELRDREMLPAIYFIFSRAGCEEAVRQCRAANLHLSDSGDGEAVRAIVDRHLAGLTPSDLDALGVHAWQEAIEAGIAAHHAGLVPPMKEAVEEAFGAGLVRVVFATETLALGINMPARSVVIERMTKFTGERHERLTPGEYTQLTGRAGRRGIDEVGYGVALWSRWTTFDELAGLASRRTYELTSSFRPNYNMAANLVRRHSREEAHHLLNLSFAQYLADRDVVGLERAISDAASALAEAEETARCEHGDAGQLGALLEERSRLRSGRSDDVAGAIARLRPGDVVRAGRHLGNVAIVRRASGRGGSPRVTAVDTRGKVVRLGSSSFRDVPVVLGHLDLPEPFQPKSAPFRREVARRLRAGAPDRRRAPAGAPASRRLAELEARIDSHPVRSCREADRHLAALTRLDRLRTRHERAVARLEARTDTLSRRFDAVLEVLEGRGFVDGWRLTDAGLLLSRLHAETDLLLAESLRAGLFDGLDPPQVAALASVFTYEERGPERTVRIAWPDRDVAERAHSVRGVWTDLAAEERAAGIPVTREPDGGFSETAFLWASGRTLEDVLDDEELSAGDFVRNTKQLVDLLRQIGEAAAPAPAAAAARAAAESVFRGVIEIASRVDS